MAAKAIGKPPAGALLREADASLLDLIDHVLNKGVVLHGDVVLGIADVDLVYVRLSLLLCAADRVLSPQLLKAKPRR